jgi:hypothetical protein
MKKLSVGLIIAISLTAFPVWASIHGGGNPRPGSRVAAAEKSVPMGSKHRVAQLIPVGGSLVNR